MQHVGPYLQGQSTNMHDVTSLAYGQRIKISLVCTLTYLSFIIFRTWSVIAWLASFIFALSYLCFESLTNK